MKDEGLIRFDCFMRGLISFILYFSFCGLMPIVPSRPLTPSPPFRRGGGVKVTFVYKFSESILFSLSSCVLNP